MRRIAGFDADALIDQLDNTRRARDDVPCVMFRGVLFKAGTTVYASSARGELELIAKVLNAIPGQRIEIGSRLGPGRPMASDAKLRTDRALLVRQSLIGLGVVADRLMIDVSESYERVAEDVMRAKGSRAQSIGLCLHSA